MNGIEKGDDIMAKWRKTCYKFKEVRELIYKADTVGIMKSLKEICDRYANEYDDFAWDFERLADEIEEEMEDLENIEENEDVADYYLSEFYDLCDAARIWLEF